MALRDSAGVRLKDWSGINDWSVDTGGYRNNVAEQNLGGLLFTTPGQSHKCAIWRGFHLAHRDFRDLMTGLVMQTAGTWKMFARFAGDAKTQPDDSPGCQTTIT
ncbi:MAG: hypothetical protein LH654_15490 [Thermoleophilia bacterium]|nr:hypothetical protein [Thermoleophilia bacterium]